MRIRTRSISPSPLRSARCNDCSTFAKTSRPALLVGEHPAHPLAGREAGFGQRRVPHEAVVGGGKHVGQPVTGEVDELEVERVPAEVRHSVESTEVGPLARFHPLVETGRHRPKLDQVEPPVPGQVHQELPATSEVGQRRLRGQCAQRSEPAAAQVRFEMQRATLLGEDAGQSLAVHIRHT